MQARRIVRRALQLMASFLFMIYTSILRVRAKNTHQKTCSSCWNNDCHSCVRVAICASRARRRSVIRL